MLVDLIMKTSLYHIKNYKANSLIFSEGDNCEYLSIILEGNISVSTITFHDKEYEIAKLTKNDLFGENLIIDNLPYLGDIIALCDTTVMHISKCNLFSLLNSPHILEEYLRALTKKNMQNMAKLKLLSQSSIRDKIMFYVISKCKNSSTNSVAISSKESLAKYLNIPRPSLSRELIALKKDKILDYDKNNLYLKENA